MAGGAAVIKMLPWSHIIKRPEFHSRRYGIYLLEYGNDGFDVIVIIFR